MDWLPVDVATHPSPLRLSSICGLSFSPSHESLYFATNLGDIVHYDFNRRQPYSYFPVHQNPILTILGHQQGVLSLSDKKLSFNATGGLLNSSWTCEGGLLCMALSRVMRSSVFLGGIDNIYYYSLRTDKVISTISVDSPAISIAASEQIFIGHESGKISVVDSRSNSIVTEVDSHPFGVSSLAVQDELLVTTGFTMRQGIKLADNTIRVYDIRTMKMVIPVLTPLGASSVRIGSNGNERIIYALSPMRYQISTTSIDMDPPRRDSIHLIQNDEVLCFDVSPTNNVIAVGSVSGAVRFFSKDCETFINNSSSPLPYPDDILMVNGGKGGGGGGKEEGGGIELEKCSDNLGSDKYWGRTKPVTNVKLLSNAKDTDDGLVFSRNDRALLPNMVQVLAPSGITKSSSSSSSKDKDSHHGLCSLDGDVSHPYWNQIIRVLRQTSTVYNSIIQHCNNGCRAELCISCEVGSLNVPADDPIHIQHFLRTLNLTSPSTLEDNDELSTYQRVMQSITTIFDLLPNQQHSLRCRGCNHENANLTFNPIIFINRIQGNLTKSLYQAVESLVKQRVWCDQCEGYRDFLPKYSLLDQVKSLVFIIDPAAYRPHHTIDTVIGLRKDQTFFHLKGLLLESHGGEKLDLRAIIVKDGHWLNCKNELVSIEKMRAITLFYDQDPHMPNGTIKPSPLLLPNGDNPCQALVGLDAEYVFYDKVQMEFCSDGSQHIVKPKKARLARLSLMEAETGLVLLDEHVALAPDEVIVDYCTHISGIRPVDLLPGKSSCTLSTRKSLIMRLQSLIDAGCTFIGHGLNNDFRVFNVNIQRKQIIDTVELFHLPGYRFLSLKFLTWHFFGDHIQTGEHDSIIDTRAAIRLYRHYQKLCSNGESSLRSALEKLYSSGGSSQWKIPQL